ncbi:MAG: peptidase M15 [Gammaproteobacteria bacterium]|nr:peptidase M15 [Gammaproteobacteria bacterium]
MNLSENFTLEELTASETAARHGIDNSPPISLDVNMRHLADGLEAVRVLLGNKPIHINSGYRCAELNKLVGGQPKSAHTLGLAADIICPEFGPPRKVCQAIQKSALGYEQCILEFNAWCHIAFAAPGLFAKRENLIIDSGGARAWA